MKDLHTKHLELSIFETQVFFRICLAASHMVADAVVTPAEDGHTVMVDMDERPAEEADGTKIEVCSTDEPGSYALSW